MAYTRQNLQDDLTAIFHGTTLDKVSNIEGLFNRSARQFLLDLDPQETIRVADFSSVFDSIYTYSAPSDLKGNKIIDIRPRFNRNKSENITQTYSEEFDLYKENQNFALEFDDLTKTLRLRKNVGGRILINGCDTVTANGTWAVSGGASNLTADTIDKVEGSGSLNFDLDGATAGVLENSSMQVVDLTDHDEKSSLFVRVYMPTVATNVILRWGNDSSNYWSRTMTTAYDGAFRVGWNVIQFDWNGATETGTVAPASIDYARVTITYTGTADTDFRVDEISSHLPYAFEVVYYSKFLFRNSSGTWIEQTTAAADLINLDTESFKIYMDLCSYLISQQLQGEDAVSDMRFFRDEYIQGIKRYKSQYKSQVQSPRSTYYRF